MLWILIGIIISYFLGAIPTAYIFTRLIRGVDIRKFGSGNVGATNAMRVLGKRLGITVLLLDILKGVIAVIAVGNFLGPKITVIPQEALRILFGVSCICGHNWTIFLQFKGGKGVATTLGVLVGLAVTVEGLKTILGLLILTWFIVFIFSRIVSLASVVTAVSFSVYCFIFRQSQIIISASILLAAFILLRHKANLIRLFQGKEPRINFKK